MKLLLTSGGITNDSLAKALEELVAKPANEIHIAFIPTAAHPQREEKGWLINDMHRLVERGYKVDIIELTALSKNELLQALGPTDVIFVGGGNTFYLSYWLQKSGLTEMLPELLKSKVYAGISAGSMIAGKSLALSSQALDDPVAFNNEDYGQFGPKGESSATTLHFVDIIFRPHLNSRYFTLVRKDLIEAKAKDLGAKVYALDDESALKVVDGTIEVVSEGEWGLFGND